MGLLGFGDMDWKQAVLPHKNNDYKKPGIYVSIVQEFVASLLFIIIAVNGGKGGLQNALAWGISFVVVRIVFKGAHLNSWITIYRIFTGNNDLVAGLMRLGAQFLGAYVAGHLCGSDLAKAFDDDNPTLFEIKAWQAGIKEFVVISIFLWCFLQADAKGDDDTGKMNENIFMILAVAVTFFFHDKNIHTLSRCFVSMDKITGCWPYLIWGVAACVMTHVKRRLMKLEKRWFFESAGALSTLDD